MISFTVHGLAQPGGSKRAIPLKGRNGWLTRSNGAPVVSVVDANPKAKSWKQEVASVAAKAMEGQSLFRGPVCLTVVFTMPRPKSHFRTGKHSDKLRDDAPKWHTIKPDCLKLTRLIEDAITGIVWGDDSQVAQQHLCKLYGDSAKVEVLVSPLDCNEP